LFLWLENPEKHPYPENPNEVLNLLFKGLVHPEPVNRRKAQSVSQCIQVEEY
jgi:hypothetical protein